MHAMPPAQVWRIRHRLKNARKTRKENYEKEFDTDCFLPAGCGDRTQEQCSRKRRGIKRRQSEKEHKEERQEKHRYPARLPEKKLLWSTWFDLESSGMATADIMQYSGFDEMKMTVLICTGGTSHWWTEEIPNDSCTVFEVKQDGLKEVYSLGEEDMAEPSTLSDFVNFAYQSYPARLWPGTESWRRGDLATARMKI